MTQLESLTQAKTKIRQAKCGVDVAAAMREHFAILIKERAPTKAETLSKIVNEFATPLLG